MFTMKGDRMENLNAGQSQVKFQQAKMSSKIREEIIQCFQEIYKLLIILSWSWDKVSAMLEWET